jgi:hypothetical protein
MLRYGTQKTAGYPSALPDIECRKRAVAGKVTSLDSAGTDFTCLPIREAFRLEGLAAALVVVLRPGAGVGRTEMRGARAPPLNFV